MPREKKTSAFSDFCTFVAQNGLDAAMLLAFPELKALAAQHPALAQHVHLAFELAGSAPAQ
jgi:hypothetical protein